MREEIELLVLAEGRGDARLSEENIAIENTLLMNCPAASAQGTRALALEDNRRSSSGAAGAGSAWCCEASTHQSVNTSTLEAHRFPLNDWTTALVFWSCPPTPDRCFLARLPYSSVALLRLTRASWFLFSQNVFLIDTTCFLNVRPPLSAYQLVQPKVSTTPGTITL